MAEDPDLHWKALLRHYDVRKPLIAAVEGWAVAGGTEILQATHIRVAGEGAVFGVFEAKRGLFPLGGSTVRLRRQIPYTVAMELLLTAREVPAEEALRIGLIGHVVPDGKALEKALEIAAVIGANGPLAVEAILRSVRETEGMSEVDGLARELEIGWPVFATNDADRGPEGLRREAPAQLHPHVSDERTLGGGLEGARSTRDPGGGYPGVDGEATSAATDLPINRSAGGAAPHQRGDDRPAARRRRHRPRRPRELGRGGGPARGGGGRLEAQPKTPGPNRVPRRPPAGPLPDQPDDRLRQPDRAAGRGVGGRTARTASARSGAASPSTTPTRARPTCVHGGVIAELFDELLGSGQHPRRRRRHDRDADDPLPAPDAVAGAARAGGPQHRAARAARSTPGAGIYHEGELTAEAEGIFIHVDAGRDARHRARQRQAPQRRGPAGRPQMAAHDGQRERREGRRTLSVDSTTE